MNAAMRSPEIIDMQRTNETVGTHMSAAPVTIQLDRDLASAIQLMEQHEIRHLAVLSGTQLVGVLSERDLAVVEALVPNDWERIPVAEAMTPEPYAVAAETPIREVAGVMAEQRYGCAMVTDALGQVVGLFTTTDALRLLAR